jgi:hypothetical protein
MTLSASVYEIMSFCRFESRALMSELVVSLFKWMEILLIPRRPIGAFR